jgi:hypothetical protein
MSLKNKKLKKIVILILLVLFFVVLPSHIAYAADDSKIAQFLSWLVLGLAGALGQILTIILGVLSKVFTWQDFSNDGVTIGWVTVRDVCNMAFILILLVIAFSTILRYENYNWKKTLPKLLMMAVLINFSKTITLLLIDFSQVIMLTFASAFAGAPGNFVQALGLKELGSLKEKAGVITNSVKDWEIFYASVLALVVVIVSIIIMIMMVVMLVMRMVMLWILIVLSPFAFLDYAVGGKYFSQWSSELSKYLISGPILAFFVWLALTILGKTAASMSMMSGMGISELSSVAGFSSWAVVMNYILAVGLLVGAMKITASMGAMGSSMGMNMATSLKNRSMSIAKKAPLVLGGAALGTAAWGARKIKASDGRFGGLELNPVNIYKGIKEGFAEKKRKEIAEGEAKSADALRKGGGIGLIKGLGASKGMTEDMARGWFGVKGMKLAYETYKAPERRKNLQALEEERNEAYKEVKPHEAKLQEINALETKMKAGEASVDEKIQLSALTAEIGGVEKVNELNSKAKQVENLNIKIIEHRKEKPVRTPYTFDANMGRKKSVRDTMSKIGDNDNSDDLVDMWRHAKAIGDKEFAAAVFLAAAKNGHSNEIIQAETGKDGKVYDTNQDGLNAFVKEQLMGKELGMAEQEALDYQSQFSSICKQVGHFNFAESIGSKNGMLSQRTAKEQESHARAEARKVDVEKYTRDRNRFGYGYETDDGRGTRKFKFNRIGLNAVMENASMIELEMEKNRFNKNASMKFLDDMDTLKKYIEATGKTTYKVVMKEKDKDGNPIIQDRKYSDLITKMEAYGAGARETGT